MALKVLWALAPASRCNWFVARLKLLSITTCPAVPVLSANPVLLEQWRYTRPPVSAISADPIAYSL